MDTTDLINMSHLKGECSLELAEVPGGAIPVDTFGGRVHMEWDSQAAVTPLGQLPFFIDFLKTADLFGRWIEDCPIAYRSNNAPKKRDIVGTLFLSVLSGHWRYAHIASIRYDTVNPGLLGMSQVMSEDSVRRAFLRAEENACAEWLGSHLDRCYGALLYEPWILDMDATVKPLYGHQEGAVVGYNPHKPGRPSHVYHTYWVANLRLVLDVEVQAGNQQAASYAQPGLWRWMDRLPQAARPAFVRGDCAWGNEGVMQQAEERSLRYLFKLRKSRKVKRLLEEVFWQRDWHRAGQGWEGVEASLQLMGWTRSRRVIVLRREIKGGLVHVDEKESASQACQLEFEFMETLEPVKKYEYAVLVTTLEDEIRTVAQHYRDRADVENNFDELKNQWGWGGYTTHDLKRCQILARCIGLIYNWWSLFVRLAIPDKHAEGITSRPLLLHGVAKQTRHGGQTTVTITSTHAKTESVQRILRSLMTFLFRIKTSAEQLRWEERWRMILSHIFRYFLGGRLLRPPPLLPEPV